jgi:hypothetical protein
MSELQSRTEFDQRERELVRSALRRYMEENRIGTPALQYRIIEADTPRHREIPLSTLQRFVTGSHHTQDHHVALCHAFVRELPYYGEGRDIAELGRALTAFLREPLDADAREDLIEKLRSNFAGSYETRALPASRGEFTYPPQSDLIASRISFEPVANQPWLSVQELVTDLLNADTPDRRFAYDGVLLLDAPLVFVFLRNTLTRQPKSYSLKLRSVATDEGEVAIFEGEGLDSWFLHETRMPRLSNYFRVQIIPSRKDPHDG